MLGFSPHMRYYIMGTFKIDETSIIVTIDKTPSKCGCSDGSMVNGGGCFIFNLFALDFGPGHRIIQRPNLNIMQNKEIFQC